ncbi:MULTISPECIES: hypothetical protein [Methylibium]|uniref:Uncharacterized protein n=1 Tax=Methylibium petroleiphilum (strain ATCC BAA-1232 / LMG 22953 / PM1) TaxID=420662 RepID=A2SHR3_METPP|nr:MULTISPECIES: hypothetical protein [Methylibium]ABM95102.1 hypothetical protein Mpe_A2146 [Methylibium petroleiphilum PM1]EWS56886.1 hypothetical protein X551_00347 [Methylibium sp. T29]EWS62045.1 hypothetical protein Y694_00275 [Methylibium sp. T29-B]MBN9206405.1 hypothetical protein [Methylibium petroleiphilum]
MTTVQKIIWAETFAQQCQALSEGRGNFHGYLDLAYELQAREGASDPALVARREFDRLRSIDSCQRATATS